MEFFEHLLGIPPVFAQAAQAGDATPQTDLLGYIFDRLPLWVTAVVVLVASIVIAAIAKGWAESRLASKVEGEHPEVLILTGRMAFLAVALTGITIALAVAGINLTTMLAAIGFGITFGMQDAISNFVAGVGILASRLFTIGDWIRVNGKVGKVEEIKTRATVLRTYDGLRLIVPNSELYKSSVLSYTSNALRRIKVYSYCRYGIDIKEVYTIIMNAVKSDNRIMLQPKATVVISELGDSYIEMQVRFWVDSRGPWRRIQSDLSINIENLMAEAGLDAPYPVTSLSLEEDVESVIFKTQQVDINEMNKIMEERKQYENETSKARNRLAASAGRSKIQSAAPDITGGQFLKTPAPVPVPITAPVEQNQTPPPETPQQ